MLHTCVPYESTEAEQEAVKHYKLERVPRELETQLDAFRDWRLSPLCYARTGNAVVDVTAGNDRAVALRFLAFCSKQSPEARNQVLSYFIPCTLYFVLCTTS